MDLQTVTAEDYPEYSSAVSTPPAKINKAKRRRRRGRLRCMLGFLIFAGLLAATRLSNLWLAFDVLSHFTLHFAVLAAAFLIGYFMPVGRVLTAFVLALIGFAGIGSYAHYASEKPRIFGLAQANERPLRIMSFNSGFANDNTEAIIQEVHRIDPDVAVLIELSEGKRVVVQQLRDKYPYHIDCIGTPYCHLAILSKAPITSSESKGLWSGPALIRASLGGQYAGVHVVGVHSIRTPYIRAQFGQMRELANYLNAFAGPLFVVGDFNATPFARVLGLFAERTSLRRVTSLPTWPGHVELPQLAIDHIFLSSGVRVLEQAKIGQRAGSDHYPVTTLVSVPVNQSKVINSERQF